MKITRPNYSSLVKKAGDNPVWKEIPVSYHEFYDGKTGFVREPFYPKQAEFAGAMLGENPTEWTTKYDEGIAFWGKGSGKDRTAAKILLYVCYKLMCMRNPNKYLSEGGEDLPSVEDKLEVGNVCINARLAKDVFFKYFTMLLRACRNPKTGKNWFVERGLNIQRDIHKRDVEFPDNITAHSLDSKEYTGEGLNLFFLIFDEIGGFEVNQADTLYKALVSTARSRFPKYMKILLLSFKRSDNDYMNIRYTRAKNEPSVFRSKGSTWEVNLKRKKDDFAKDYAKDPETSERIYECSGTTSEGGFFRYRNRITQVINISNMENPIVGDKITTVDLNSLTFKEFFKPVEGAVYFGHVDLAKGKKGGDAAGLALAHYDPSLRINFSEDYVKALSNDSGFSIEKIRQEHDRVRGGVVVDLLLQIKAPPGGEIMFEEVRKFYMMLRKHHKFHIKKLTYDGWQSTDSIQQLRKAGIPADEQSVDKDPRAYITLKNCMYEGVYKGYLNPIAVRELEDLIIVNMGRKEGSVHRFKVDHPEKSSRRWEEDGRDDGSKDVADALAGATALAIEYGRSEFKFWAGETKDSDPNVRKTETPTTVQRHESEKLVRYGEKPPSWYGGKGSIGS